MLVTWDEGWVIKLIIFGGIKLILRDFLYNRALFGLAI